MKYWKVAPQWKGRTVILVGGGPSAIEQELHLLKHRSVIAINNSWEIAPWAQIHYAYDRRWYKWNRHVFDKFEGVMATAMPHEWEENPKRLFHLHRNEDLNLAFDPRMTHVAGRDSGTMAINLAVHLGAKRLILVGYDMHFPGGKSHWHPDHPVESKEKLYRKRFRKMHNQLVPIFDARGIRVINASPESHLKVWSRMTLRQALVEFGEL